VITINPYGEFIFDKAMGKPWFCVWINKDYFPEVVTKYWEIRFRLFKMIGAFGLKIRDCW